MWGDEVCLCGSVGANYYGFYNERMPPHVLADRLGQFMHVHTCYGGYRPFGVGLLVAAYDEQDKRPYLHLIKPSGQPDLLSVKGLCSDLTR